MTEQRPQRLTKQRLKELASDPQTVVYEYQHDQVDALPMAQVQDYARKIYLWRCQYQRDNKPYEVTEARRHLTAQAKNDSETMHRFCTYTHKPIFDHLTRFDAGIKEFRNVLEMIDTKRKILEGGDEAALLGSFKSKLLEQYSQSSRQSSSVKNESKKGRK
tara:strand:- start:151 stop:633 length:483 start_codon:yes stop_codon:yes gene_type:complete